MKLIRFFCYSFIIISQGIYANQQQNNPANAIVCIESILENGETKIGTGFFIAPGIIVTVTHQVIEAKTITVYGDSFIEKAKLVLEPPGLAVLNVNNKNIPYLLLENKLPNLQTNVYTYGCQSNNKTGKPQKILSARGHISDPKRADGENWYIEANLAIKKGHSGGPLINENQQVVGIVNGYDANNTQLSVSIPSGKLIQIMAQQQSIPFASEITQLWQKAQNTQDKFEQLKIYTDLLTKTPWHTEAHYNQGMLYFGQQDYQNALHQFLLATQQRPNFYNAYVYLGMTFSALKDFTEARNNLINALLIDRKNPLAYSMIANIYQTGLADTLSERNALQQYINLETNQTKVEIAQKRLQAIEKAIIP